MTKVLKIRKIGGSLGVVLPKDVLADLGVGEGDLLYPVRTSEGVRFLRHDPDFEEALDAGRAFMQRYPSAMKKLAE